MKISTEQFWIIIWGMIITGIVLIITIINYSIVDENQVIKELVEKGHDPEKIYCLFNGDTERCAIETLINNNYKTVTIMYPCSNDRNVKCVINSQRNEEK